MVETPFRTVAIVAGICVTHDAISASVRDDALSLSEPFGFRSRVFTYANEFADIDAVVVRDLYGVLFDPFFLSCDLIVYHFGIYYELFNAIFAGNGVAPQVVRYHNLTPQALLPASEWRLFERSSVQLHNLAAADAVWPVSDVNGHELIESGIVPQERVQMIPLSVGDGRRVTSMTAKSSQAIQILFVGRFVKSKGLVDLVQAVARLARQDLAFEARLVGSLRFSDPDFLRMLNRLIGELRLEHCITVVGGVGDDELEQEYARAHILAIPSYHEGFCKPVIEAMRHGCVPVTYDASNLKYVARGLSRTVRVGDVSALGDALINLAVDIRGLLRRGDGQSVLVDRGRLELGAYEAAVDDVLKEYGFPAVSQALRQSATRLIETRAALVV
ncbi:MAG: glycosyltransferase family 4 protein [Alphaproteobacteria bacterium]|nr:glycosyltransferase family 4 protein [Alphaproteobacteria bacterium]